MLITEELLENPFLTRKLRTSAKNFLRNVGVIPATGNYKRDRKLRALSGTCTETEWAALLDRYNHRCLCCGKLDTILTRDHIIPIALPGSSNGADNMQPLCKDCNTLKGQRIVDYRYDHSSLMKSAYQYKEVIQRGWRSAYRGYNHYMMGNLTLCKAEVPETRHIRLVKANSLTRKCLECQKLLENYE